MPQSYSPVYFPQDWSPISMSAANQVTDSCTDDASSNIGNYATWNPLDQQYSGFTYAEGNKRISTGTSSGGQTTSTIAVGSGRYYAEVLINSWATSNGVGIAKPGQPNNGSVNVHLQNVIVGKIYNNGVENQTGLTTLSATNVVGIDLDIDGGTVQFYLNNSTYGSAESLTAGEGYAIFAQSGGNSADLTLRTEPADWSYSAKGTGVPFCTANLPAPTVTNSSDHFTVKTLVNGSSPNTSFDTGLASVGLIMAKRTDGAGGWEWFDIARGANALLQSNNNDDEVTKSGFSFSGGTFNFDNTANLGQANTSHVVFSWLAGGSPSSDEGGAITSNVSAAGHGGFSVGTYSGTGSASTVGHGLSRAPSWVIVKMRSGSGTQTWTVWQEDIFNAANADYIILSSSAAKTNGASFSSTAPTSSAFSVGNDATNQSGSTFCFWAFAKTPGLIASGSYTGNGSSDGPMIVVDDGGSGFKPAWLMIKRTNNTDDWKVSNSVMSPFNPVLTNSNLNINTAAAVDTPSGPIDYLANGFKPRLANGPWNASGDNYIYLAFAENPFGGNGVAQAKVR